MGMLGNISHLVCAVLVCFPVFTGTDMATAHRWHQQWFSIGEKSEYYISLSLENWSSILWVSLATLGFLFEYFKTVSRSEEYQGRRISRSLLLIGAFFTLLSGNLITFYFGWTLISLSIFIGISVDKMGDQQNSQAAIRYYILSVVGQLLVLIGVLGLFVRFGFIDFSELNDNILKSSDQSFFPAIAALVVGVMATSFQVPFLINARYISSLKEDSPYYFILGHILCSSVLLTKMYPVILGIPGIEYFSIIPGITCLVKHHCCYTIFSFIQVYNC